MFKRFKVWYLRRHSFWLPFHYCRWIRENDIEKWNGSLMTIMSYNGNAYCYNHKRRVICDNTNKVTWVSVDGHVRVGYGTSDMETIINPDGSTRSARHAEQPGYML